MNFNTELKLPSRKFKLKNQFSHAKFSCRKGTTIAWAYGRSFIINIPLSLRNEEREVSS